MKLGITRMGKLTLSAAILASATLVSGCAIHSQGPIKEVAYDFSDGVLYDRAYAPSPEYEAGPAELAPLRQRADALARSLAAAEAARTMPIMPPASAVMVVVPEQPSVLGDEAAAVDLGVAGSLAALDETFGE